MKTTEKAKATATATANTAENKVTRIMAKRSISTASLLGGFEEASKNHEACIAEVKRMNLAKQGKASLTDTEGEAVRFLDPSVFMEAAKRHERGSRWRASLERCAAYLRAIESLNKAGVI